MGIQSACKGRTMAMQDMTVYTLLQGTTLMGTRPLPRLLHLPLPRPLAPEEMEPEEKEPVYEDEPLYEDRAGAAPQRGNPGGAGRANCTGGAGPRGVGV